MGQKINPTLYRLSIKKHWRSSTYVKTKDYSKSLLIDFKIRTYLTNLASSLQISLDNILIKKYSHLNLLYISVNYTSSNNISDINIQQIINHLSLITGYKNIKISLKEARMYKNVPIFNASLLAKYIAKLIETRSKIGIKKLLAILKENIVSNSNEGYLESNLNLKGYKFKLSGRLNGVEMARHKIYKSGSIPLQNIEKPIDYSYTTAYTKYGIIGIKVWLLY